MGTREYMYQNGKNIHVLIPLWGVLFVLYIYIPFRIWDFSPVFEQIEEWTLSCLFLSFSCLGIMFFSLKRKDANSISVSWIDVLIAIYGIYSLLRSPCLSRDTESQIRILTLFLIYFHLRILPITYLHVCLSLICLSIVGNLFYEISLFQNPWDTTAGIEGLFHNTGLFGGFVGIGVVCSLWALLYKYPSRISGSVLFVFFLIQLYVSASRASWVGVLSCAFFLVLRWIFDREKQPLTPKMKTIGSIGISVTLLVVIAIFYLMRPESANGRLYIWQVTSRIFFKSPINGIGENMFRSQYMTEQAMYLQENPSSPFSMIADESTVPFNEFIRVLTEQGIIGFVLLGMLIWRCFSFPTLSETSFLAHKWRIVFMAVFLYLLLFSFFSYPSVYIQYQIIFLLCIAALAHFDTQKIFSVSRLNKWVVAGLFSLYLFWGSYKSVRYLSFMNQWNECLKSRTYGFATQTQEMQLLHNHLSHNSQFLISYAYTLMREEAYESATTIWKELLQMQPSYHAWLQLGICYEKQAVYDKAIYCWGMASAMIPSRFRPDYLCIQVYLKQNDMERSKQMMHKFLMREQKVDSPEVDRMRDDVRQWADSLPIP